MRAWVLGVVLACGTSQTPPSPDVGFHSQVFGRGPNVTAVMRVRDTLRDPLYGPYLRKAFAKEGNAPHSLASAAVGVEEIDVACDVHENMSSDAVGCIAIVFGSFEDPSTIREDDRALFDSPKRLASGATEWAVASGKEWALFSIPHAWVFAHGNAIDGARATFTRDASPPPRLDLEPTALVAASIRGSALDARDVSRRSLDGSAKVIAQSLDSGELVVMPSASGDVISRFWMMDEDSAKILEGELLSAMRADAECNSGCRLVRAMISSAIDVHRSGSFVSVRVHLPESILKKVL